MPKIARVWFGKVFSSQAEEYFEYVRKTGVKDLSATPGNQGVLLLQREHNGITEISVISFWESRLAIEGFAGKDIEQAVYYPEDSRFLLEMEPKLHHFDVSVATGLKLTDESLTKKG
jgi:heme-degrading monooxygenase HmoA